VLFKRRSLCRACFFIFMRINDDDDDDDDDDFSDSTLPRCSLLLLLAAVALTLNSALGIDYV